MYGRFKDTSSSRVCNGCTVSCFGLVHQQLSSRYRTPTNKSIRTTTKNRTETNSQNRTSTLIVSSDFGIHLFITNIMVIVDEAAAFLCLSISMILCIPHKIHVRSKKQKKETSKKIQTLTSVQLQTNTFSTSLLL